jgi:hypothetical protein
LRKALSGDDAKEMQSLTEALEHVTSSLAQEILNASVAQALAGKVAEEI